MLKHLILCLTLLCMLHSTVEAKDTVCFSPDGKCVDLIVAKIKTAKKTILVQAYVFSDHRIANALIAAKARGVAVSVIIDNTQSCAKWSQADELVAGGVELFVDKKHAIQHNKSMVIDSQYIVTGSYNFTFAADTKNAENLLILSSAKLAEAYTKDWEKHKVHIDPFSCPVK